jgi:hypothetical protein
MSFSAAAVAGLVLGGAFLLAALARKRTLHQTAAQTRSCHYHWMFGSPIRSGHPLPAAVGELFVGRLGSMRQFKLLIAVVLVVAGCASKPTSSARHTKQEAIQIAAKYVRDSAQQQGTPLDLGLYRKPEADYDPKRQEWSVLFLYKQPDKHPTYDRGFVIIVFDLTGNALPFPNR